MAIMSNMCCASHDKKLLDSVPVLAAYGHRPTEDKSKENTMIDFFCVDIFFDSVGRLHRDFIHGNLSEF